MRKTAERSTKPAKSQTRVTDEGEYSGTKKKKD